MSAITQKVEKAHQSIVCAVNLSRFRLNFSQCVGLRFIRPSHHLSPMLIELLYVCLLCSASVVMITRLMLNIQNPALFGTHFTLDSNIEPFVAIAGGRRQQSACSAFSHGLEGIDGMTENPAWQPEWTWTLSDSERERTISTNTGKFLPLIRFDEDL